MKNIVLFPILFFALFMGACENATERDMTIELACPKLSHKIKDNVVIITWSASAKAAAYAYKLDNGEFVKVTSDVLTYSAKVENGAHTFAVYAVGDNSHTTDSALRTLEFEMNYDATLPAPSPSVSTSEGLTTISWAAIPKAKGYGYKVDGAAAFTTVGADVLTYSGKFKTGSHTFTIYAIGDGVDSKDSPEKVAKFDVINTAEGVFVKKTSGAIIELSETESMVYTAEIACAKSDTFTILIDDVEYGFLSYSGNGGVGTVNNLCATVPFYNAVTYYVRESVGWMTNKKDSDAAQLNKFYTNLSADAKVFVRVDRSEATPVYSLKLVETPNPSILVEQHFDLCVWGGDWVIGNSIKGSGPSADVTEVDGMEAATPNTLTYAASGTTEASTKLGDEAANPKYIRNRGLQGWSWTAVVEHPGYMHVSVGKSSGALLTPVLSMLTGPTTVTAEIDICRFSSVDPIQFVVTGGGVIKSCVYHKDGATTETTATVSGSEAFFAFTTEMSSPYNAGTDKTGQKEWSHFKFVIENATAATRVGIDSSKASGSVANQRVCVDNIVVKKLF
ncbi:MAG: hypothetical protein RSB23_02145 [Alistipes sp.]